MFPLQYSKVNYITSANAAWEAMNDILSYDLIGFDVETSGLSVIQGDRMRLGQFALPNGTVHVFDFNHVDRRILYHIFPHPGIIVGQNLKFDFSFVNHELGIKTFGECFDTLLMAQLVSQGGVGGALKFGLNHLTERFLGIETLKDEQTSDWTRPELSNSQIEYAAKDAWVMLPLYEKLQSVLLRQKQMRVAKLENEALPAVVQMELNGMELDQEAWTVQYHKAQEDVKEYQSHLWDFFDGFTTPHKGKGLEFHPQLFEGARTMDLTTVKMKEAFAVKGIELPLDANGLPTMRDFKIAGAIASGAYSNEAKKALQYAIKYAQIKKQLTSYGLEWFNHILRDGRIHQSYKQIGADTGRMSCFNPNLTQIPKGDEYRNCFIAGAGWVFVDCDYSQCELRILAELCLDPNFLDAFDSGLDLHRYTASLLNKVAFDEVTDKQRGIAKNMNFLMAYGGGPMKLSESAGISFDEAKIMLDLYLKQTYPKLGQWLGEQGKHTARTMMAETMSGRKRLCFGDVTDDGVKARIERIGKNMPIQGSNADITKRALHFVYERFKHNPNVQISHVIHDEILIRARPWVADEVQSELIECMLRAEREYLHRVPSAVDGSITLQWCKSPTEQQIQAGRDYINKWRS